MKTEDNKTDSPGCALAILQIAVAAPMVMWRGYVLSILWVWFVVKTFGVEPLSLPSAIGLSLIVSYLTHQMDFRKDERTTAEKFLSAMFAQTLWPALTLLSGWIINHWM